MSELSNEEDLSITLLERRKRFHELATEINQWEDESNKINTATPMSQDLLNSTCFNRTTNSPNQTKLNKSAHSSPLTRKFCQNYNDSGIAPPKVQKMNSNSEKHLNIDRHQLSTDFRFNKENLTITSSSKLPQPSASSTSIVRSTSNKEMKKEFSQAEMLNVAKKILAKREQHTEQDPNNSVRAMKEKFENMTKNVNEQSALNEEVHLTPRLLIKKFEAMSKDGPLQSTATTSASRPIEIKKSSGRVVSSFLSNIDTAIQSSPQCNSTKIIDCSSKSSDVKSAPKYDIEFIDSTDTTQVDSDEDDDEVDTDEDDDELSDEEEEEDDEEDDNSDYEVEETYIQDKTLTPKAIVEKFESLKKMRESEETAKFSLTFVSSITNGGSNISSGEQSKTEIIYENVNRQSEPLYEELNNTNHSNIDEIYMKKQEIIKNFKIDYEEEDDYDDADDTQFGRNSQNTSKFTTTSSNVVSRAVSAETISSYGRSSDSYSISSIGSESQSNQDFVSKEQNDQLSDIGIYSIKDYRRQKRTGGGKSARKSLLQQNTASSSINGSDGVELKKKLNLIDDKTKAANSASTSNMGRIKELEDFIENEDNIMNQTKLAIEHCLQDTQFTGSIEHIECNRILLVSCQKRQLFLTEISRLKQKMGSNTNNKIEEASEDLSGTLVFSDIQLPIKDLYMNKLKSGEEKRIFHFICLLRYGIQVLQTQVISVQELLGSKDTIITFPNRMAISNVDVNFKVKIDVYAMETNPKEKHKKSPSKLDAKKFFQSPFKSNVFSSNHHHDSNSGHSSGGFATLKISNFIHIDTIEITHKDIVRENFKLNISSSSIPLIGVLHIEVRCMPSKSIELRGFLTMFEDVSGYGAWDRRWFMLSNNSLSFWKYPEDEFRKSPLGIINLIECTTEKPQMLSRDICARKYTFELICVKAREKTEESDDSLISKSYDKYKFTKYWLSADTRENANDWINHINWALTNIRLWNPNAVKPICKKTA